jgi:hypothetical protein
MREQGAVFPIALVPQSYRIERRMFVIDCLNVPRLPGQQTRQGFQLFIISQLLLPILNPRFQLIRRTLGQPGSSFPMKRIDGMLTCSIKSRHLMEAQRSR